MLQVWGGWPQEVCVSDPPAKAQKAKDQERYGFYIEQSLENIEVGSNN